MPETPSLTELLKAGVHFGHKTSRRHPRMAPYIFTEKAGVHIINLEITQQKLQEALDFVKNLGREGKILLFVGTKKQVRPIIRKYAEECGAPYVAEKWLGGTFSNFSEIHKIIRKYLDLKDKQMRGELAKYTKKEQLKFAQEIEKMEKKIGGITTLNHLPDAVFIVDLKHEKTAVKEASRKKIPIVGVCDTNVDPTPVDYPIPANDDAIKSVELIVRLIAEAYQQGKQEREGSLKEESEKENKPTTEEES
jgi:small subunit ribosomal protein S2